MQHPWFKSSLWLLWHVILVSLSPFVSSLFNCPKKARQFPPFLSLWYVIDSFHVFNWLFISDWLIEFARNISHCYWKHHFSNRHTPHSFFLIRHFKKKAVGSESSLYFIISNRPVFQWGSQCPQSQKIHNIHACMLFLSWLSFHFFTRKRVLRTIPFRLSTITRWCRKLSHSGFGMLYFHATSHYQLFKSQSSNGFGQVRGFVQLYNQMAATSSYCHNHCVNEQRTSGCISVLMQVCLTKFVISMTGLT